MNPDTEGLSGGPRLPYDETWGVCPRCLGKVRITVGTDGDGHLVESMGPCRSCGRGLHMPFGMAFRLPAPGAPVPPRRSCWMKPVKVRQPRPLKECEVAAVRRALLVGVGVTAVAHATGVPRERVRAMRNAMKREGLLVTCACGKPANHVGRCVQKGRTA